MRHLPTFSLLALGIGLAGTALAEHVQLPDSTVIGQQQPDPTAPSVAEKRAGFAHIPGGAAVVDAETYKTGRSSLQDALGLDTGLNADTRGRDSAQFLPDDGRARYAGLEWRL